MRQSIISLSEIGVKGDSISGGKAATLARLIRQGFPVPSGVCLSTDLYRKYLDETGVGEKIFLELSRKDLARMRWEEIWDCALRIRNFFLRTPIPSSLTRTMAPFLENRFGELPVAVRSSAPGEDSAGSSFAGLHESFVNVSGIEAILFHIRLVWASLWSDSALLYRQELGLEIEKSSMAVIVQELVRGERSGVAFSMGPQNSDRGILESVWGLNQGLVDGTVEPDRWFMDRNTGKILRHEPPSGRKKAIRPLSEGTGLLPLEKGLAGTPPLSPGETERVFRLTMDLEAFFGAPQDVEWTFRGQDLYVLQARPITTLGEGSGEDHRSWYLSLRRSYENLSLLGEEIEEDLLPAMDREARELAAKELSLLSATTLSAEVRSRIEVVERWENIYRDKFIPFAHGVRLFGQFYNDRFSPEDPFDFVPLLRGEDLKSTERNGELHRLARALAGRDRSKGMPEPLRKEMEDFLAKYGPLPGIAFDREDMEGFVSFLDQMKDTALPAKKTHHTASPGTEAEFIDQLPESEKVLGHKLLLLARKSWKIRDDDNIYLGRIQAQLKRGLREAAERVESKTGKMTDVWSPEDLLAGLLDPDFTPATPEATFPVRKDTEPGTVLVRQVRGQPASPGIATGKAKVIADSRDLKDFKPGEILVCDAIDPTMTFIVPMASAIVERRGGMLIHGAIIAREYGIPCVTGIPDVTDMVRTGDTVTVDGHLGLLVITERKKTSEGSLSKKS